MLRGATHWELVRAFLEDCACTSIRGCQGKRILLRKRELKPKGFVLSNFCFNLMEMALLVNRACGRYSDAEKVREDSSVPAAGTPVSAVTSSSSALPFGRTMDVEEGISTVLLERGLVTG